MANKKLILIVGVMLVAVGIISLGARPTTAVRVPPGPIVESPNARANAHKEAVIPDAPALPATQAPVAVLEDFSAGLSRWQTLQTAPATWGAQAGRLQQWGDANGEPVDEPSVLVLKDVALADGKIEAQIFPTGGSPVGLAFRGSDAGYYRLDLYPNLPNKQAKAVLSKVTSQGEVKVGLTQTPASAWQGYTYNAWQLVSVSLMGSSISASVDGAPVLTATDSSFTSGWAGVWTFANTGAQFDNVRVETAGSR